MLRQRIITALILAPIVLGGVFLLPLLYFTLFIGVIIAIGGWEWAALAGLKGGSRYAYALLLVLCLLVCWFLPVLPVLIVGAGWWCLALLLVIYYPAAESLRRHNWQVCLYGLAVLVPAWVSMKLLKSFPDGNVLILTLFLLIWSADIGAYFAGRAFGSRKLAPRVSPGKTWEGLLGGVVLAAGLLVLIEGLRGHLALHEADWWRYAGACLVVVLVSILGDLTESLFKRQAGVKDSSNLLPGHGGVLDRIDSLVAAGPVFGLVLLQRGIQ